MIRGRHNFATEMLIIRSMNWVWSFVRRLRLAALCWGLWYGCMLKRGTRWLGDETTKKKTDNMGKPMAMQFISIRPFERDSSDPLRVFSHSFNNKRSDDTWVSSHPNNRHITDITLTHCDIIERKHIWIDRINNWESVLIINFISRSRWWKMKCYSKQDSWTSTLLRMEIPRFGKLRK